VNEAHFIPKTLATIFPYSDSFGGYIVNSNQPLAYDADYMSQTYNQYLETQSAFLSAAAPGAMDPQAILDHPRQSHARILHAEEGVPALTDLTPWLEYYYACPPRFIQMLQPQQLKYCSSQNIR